MFHASPEGWVCLTHLSESRANSGDGGDGVSPRAEVGDAPKELEGVALLLQGVVAGALAHDVHLLIGKTKPACK